MFKLFDKPGIRLAIIGITIAFGVHFWEIYEQQLTATLHVTADDVSYSRPALNWWEHGTWKDGFEGASSFVQRPPLMGIVELIGYWLLGNSRAWFVFGAALLVHACTISRLYNVLSFFTNDRRAVIGTSVFIALPCFWGFLSYSITEAFEIGLCIIALSYIFIPSPQQIQKIFIFILLIALFRPVLVVLFIPILFYKLWKNRQQIRFQSIFRKELVAINLVLAVLIGTTVFWEIRKTVITGEVLNPHPIYHETNQTVFRPPHAALTELFKIWETRPEVFHDFVGRTWQTDPIQVSRKEIAVYCAERNVPIHPETLYLILVAYGNLTPEMESSFCYTIEGLTEQVKSKQHYQYWIKTPLTGIREQGLKSQLNLTVFQETYRGNWLIEALRFISLAVVLLSYLAILVVPFTRSAPEIRLIALGCWIYGFLLFWVQRMNEDRYMLPLLAIGFVLLISQKLKNKDGRGIINEELSMRN